MEEQVQLQQSQNMDNEGKPKKRFGIFFIGVLLGTLITGTIACFIILQQSKTTIAYDDSESVINAETISKLQKLEDGIETYYLNDSEPEELQNSLYHGLVAGLGDPYSTYYSPEELEDILESTKGVYYGIGAYIGYDTTRDYCKIAKCMENSPAKEVGLLPDDIIVEVDEIGRAHV